MAKKFDPSSFEEKWRKKWSSEGTYDTPEIAKGDEKFYSLYSYPYPSGAGLHVGHVEGMVANDIPARYNRMLGKKVMMPMGWDSFGLPAENYAIKTGIHPKDNTDEAIEAFKDQINNVGISVDWETEVGAHYENYYKWTQWIFLQLYKAGLAYKKKSPVNWCPKDQTVLANEQVEAEGTCERCGTKVVQKDLEQWFFKITDFADRLVDDLDKVDWPESTKIQQREWIGRSEGMLFKAPVKDTDIEIETFSAHFEAFAADTFVVIAPDHPILPKLVKGLDNEQEILKKADEMHQKQLLNKNKEEKESEGIFIGRYIEDPVGNGDLPIWIASYALSSYGTGIVKCSAHDERDFKFAKKYDIPLKTVLIPFDADKVESVKNLDTCFYDFSSGYLAEPLNLADKNQSAKEQRDEVIRYLEENRIAKKVTTYRLRDWLLSRQRYWGCPIPIVYDPEGNAHPVDEKDLPVVLPYDVDFSPTGESPLAKSEEFQKSAEEKYGKGFRREVDTMDTFVDSSWYFFRHVDADNKDKIFDSKKVNAWLPTDLYMIGAEHIVLHLMYSRFFTKFLFDQGIIDFDEPFYKMRHMGLILGPDGRKMSKRWGNVINPNDEINKYGADTLRMYEMFMGPLEEAKPWNDRAEKGVFKFLSKVWDNADKISDEVNEQQEKEINKLIKYIGPAIETLSFNTAVAKMMEFTNFLTKEEKVSKSVFERFLLVLAPFAPYITEELWSNLGNEFSVHNQKWPEFDEELAKDDVITLAIQVNGKVRGTVSVAAGSDEDTVMKAAMEIDNVKKYIQGEPKKVIYIQDRILNLII